MHGKGDMARIVETTTRQKFRKIAEEGGFFYRSQHGFRKRGLMLTGIDKVIRRAEKTRENSIKVKGLFLTITVDIKNAFSSLLRNTMLKLLKVDKIPRSP